ncbi:MAG TPA: thioesterase family protein, partial [Lacibacter sp.]|nr:thioesterase family protein [Lacibacter sp.]
MSRIKIDLPAGFRFFATIPLRITDMNYGNHVGNDAVLSLLHEARMQFLQHHGFTELDCGGTGLIMLDAGIEFKKELFYGDQIKVGVAAANLSGRGFDLYYRVDKIDNGVTDTAVKAKTGMLCFDYSRKKLVPVPDSV